MKTDLPSLEHWEKYFDYVSASDFLCGRTQGRDGKPPFLADQLEWITKPANYAKIYEGKCIMPFDAPVSSKSGGFEPPPGLSAIILQ